MSYDVELTDRNLLAIMAAIIFASYNSTPVVSGCKPHEAVEMAEDILEEVDVVTKGK